LKLSVRHALLDPEFEGYKLSLDSVPLYHATLDDNLVGRPLKVRTADQNQFSYLHAKMFQSGANCLVSDPFGSCTENSGEETPSAAAAATAYAVVIDDSGTESVLQVKLTSGGKVETMQVWKAAKDEGSMTGQASGDYNPSLSFPSAEMAFLADGRGGLYLLKTSFGEDKSRSRAWEAVFHDHQICGSKERPFRIASSHLLPAAAAAAAPTLDVLIQYVDEKAKVLEEPTPEAASAASQSYVNVVEWMSFVERAKSTKADVLEWQLDRVRRFVFQGSLDYLDLAKSASSANSDIAASCTPANKTGFWCLTEKPFRLVFDSAGVDVPDDDEEKMAVDESGGGDDQVKPPPFYWMQGTEDMVVWVQLPPDTNKREIKVSMRPSEMRVSIKGEEVFGGKLWNVLDGDSMTWTIQNRTKLEITACKANVGLIWQNFLRLDNPAAANVNDDGYEVQDARAVDELISQFRAAAAEAKSGSQVPTEDQQEEEMDSNKKIYNAQELESCDDAPEESFSLHFIDGERCVSTHRASASGRQWICNIPVDASAAADATSRHSSDRVCLRHDVDGLVWQPEATSAAGDPRVEHEGTFNALGYVQASKQQRKFTVAPADMNYVAICDVSRHVYVYRQPSSTPLTGSQLRNRKSGQRVEKVAKQQVIALQDNKEEVVGAVATKSLLFVLTLNSVMVARINEE